MSHSDIPTVLLIMCHLFVKYTKDSALAVVGYRNFLWVVCLSVGEIQESVYRAGLPAFFGVVCLSVRQMQNSSLTLLDDPPFFWCRMFVCHTDVGQWSYRAGLPPFHFSCVVCFSVRQVQDSTLTMLGYRCVFLG